MVMLLKYLVVGASSIRCPSGFMRALSFLALGTWLVGQPGVAQSKTPAVLPDKALTQARYPTGDHPHGRVEAHEKKVVSEKWEEVLNKKSVTVWRSEVPGSPLVKFRGVTHIKEASIKKIITVVTDLKRRTEWQSRCRTAHRIQEMAPDNIIGYYRLIGPFMVSDRDVVFDAVIYAVPEERTIQIDFKQTDHLAAPVKDGVVRMPMLQGYWRFHYLDATTTEVTYEVHADPGGWVPTWIVNRASKNLPFHSLNGLQSQVAASGYEENLRWVEKSIDWHSFERATGSLQP